MELNFEEQHRLCRLRSTLEAFAVECWRNSPQRDEIHARLLKYMDALHTKATRGDYSGFYEVDVQLHRELIASANLPVLLKNWELVGESLDNWIHHVQETYWPSLMALYREHVLLLEAWNSAEPWVAEQATHQHLEAGWYRVAAVQGSLKEEIDPVDRATSFISTHYASKLEIGWIAQNVSFVSASHLTRLFREKLGTSPHSFLRRIRLERGGELVRSGPDNISVISARVGYNNTSHFVRDFKNHYGVTPLIYRRSNSTKPANAG